MSSKVVFRVVMDDGVEILSFLVLGAEKLLRNFCCTPTVRWLVFFFLEPTCMMDAVILYLPDARLPTGRFLHATIGADECVLAWKLVEPDGDLHRRGGGGNRPVWWPSRCGRLQPGRLLAFVVLVVAII